MNVSIPTSPYFRLSTEAAKLSAAALLPLKWRAKMSKRTVENLSDRERACLEHLRQAQELGLSFSQYCRERDLKINQFYWVKRGLIRKGVIAVRRRGERDKSAGFVPVRIAASATGGSVACRIRHPLGWTIECTSLPEASWMSALVSGETA